MISGDQELLESRWARTPGTGSFKDPGANLNCTALSYIHRGLCRWSVQELCARVYSGLRTPQLLRSRGSWSTPNGKLNRCRLPGLSTIGSYLVESPVDFTALPTCPRDILAVAWALQGHSLTPTSTAASYCNTSGYLPTKGSTPSNTNPSPTTSGFIGLVPWEIPGPGVTWCKGRGHSLLQV